MKSYLHRTIIINLYGYLEIAQWSDKNGQQHCQVVLSVDYDNVVWC
jgi:hypothetical protein